jgi:predicted O-methyltransferase YrrM
MTTRPAHASPATTAYADDFLGEDAVLRAARARADELGVAPVTPAAGAILRFLAAAVTARTVVEVGTGTGVSGVWLLRGMRPDGVLTTIDREPEHQALARSAFAEAGVPTGRTRLIPGRALDVLPRLADGGYDLMHVDGPPREAADYLAEALRLLRPSGIVVFANAFWHGRVGDQHARDPETVAVRALHVAVREEPRLTPVLLPVGGGLLAATVWSTGDAG